MVMVALFGPALVGRNRIGTSIDVPGAITSGNDKTCGVWNSGELDTIPVTVSGQVPVLAIVTILSRNAPSQTRPKSPESTTIVVIVGLPTEPDTAIVADGFVGSLLATVSVPDWGPIPVGEKVTAIGRHVPGAIVTGKPDVGGATENWAFDDVMLVTIRFAAPVLQILAVA